MVGGKQIVNIQALKACEIPAVFVCFGTQRKPKQNQDLNHPSCQIASHHFFRVSSHSDACDHSDEGNLRLHHMFCLAPETMVSFQKRRD